MWTSGAAAWGPLDTGWNRSYVFINSLRSIEREQSASLALCPQTRLTWGHAIEEGAVSETRFRRSSNRNRPGAPVGIRLTLQI